MQAQIAIGSTTSYELCEALLAYRRDRAASGQSHAETFVTHDPIIYGKDKAPEIGPDATLTQEAPSFRDGGPQRFSPGGVPSGQRPRPHQRRVIWWTPPSVRRIFYTKGEGKEMAALSGLRCPQPGLIFRAGDRSLDVCAVAGTERPDPETTLARAPYWNVGDSGAVCLGSANVPRDLSVASIPQWEQGFFESEFTHANGAQRLTAHPSGFAGL